MPYVLDANWAIHALAGRPPYVDTLRRFETEGLALSWVTVGEVYEGAFGLPNPQGHLASFRRFMQPLRILGLNDPIMERFAEVRALLRRRGELIPDLDIIVGATALHHDLTPHKRPTLCPHPGSEALPVEQVTTQRGEWR